MLTSRQCQLHFDGRKEIWSLQSGRPPKNGTSQSLKRLPTSSHSKGQENILLLDEFLVFLQDQFTVSQQWGVCLSNFQHETNQIITYICTDSQGALVRIQCLQNKRNHCGFFKTLMKRKSDCRCNMFSNVQLLISGKFSKSEKLSVIVKLSPRLPTTYKMNANKSFSR